MNIFQRILYGRPQAQLAAAITKNKDRERVSYKLARTWVLKAQMQMDEWRSAILMARDPYYYNRIKLYTIYDETMLDAHVFSQHKTIHNTVISEPFEVQNETGTLDEDKTDLLCRPWFDQYIKFALDAELYGHSLIEFGPLGEPKNGVAEFSDIQLIPRIHVKPEWGKLLLDPYRNDTSIPYREAPFNTWLLEVGDPFDLGVLRIVSREVIWKLFSRSDWSRASEKFGMPFIVVRTPSNQEKELDAKEAMLANFGSNSYAIMDNDDQIELLETAKTDAYQVYLQLATFCDDQMSKAINGQTGSSDQKAFVGAAQVHERLLDDYTRARLKALEYHVNFVLFPFLIGKGYPLEGFYFCYPRLTAEPAPTPQEKGDPNDPNNPDNKLALKKKVGKAFTIR